MQWGVGPPFRHWFNEQNHTTLGSLKYYFLSGTGNITLSLSSQFEDFIGWLHGVHEAFIAGMTAKSAHKSLVDKQGHQNGWSGCSVIPPFDDKTLGGHVSYSALIDPAHNLQGRLKGLIICYESQPIHHVQTQGLST